MAQLAVGEFAEIASGLYLEGLSVDHTRDVIWYSDVIGGGIHGVKPDGTAVGAFNESRKWTGGVLMNADGAVLSSGEAGIMWNNPDTGKSGWLLDCIDDEPINGINEMILDGCGGIYFGTVDLEMITRGRPPRPTALYRLTAERKVILMIDGLGFTNGLMFDAPRQRFYCNETFSCTLAFDVARDGSLKNRSRFCEKTDVDGMALDSAGNLWITGVTSNYLTRVTPEGAELPRVQTPAGSITQLRFGGADLRDYYLLSVPGTSGETLKEGGQITQVESHLYRGRSDIAGLAVEPARFTLS